VKRKTQPQAKSREPRLESYALSSLDQIKAMSHPLRVRILGTLCQERTTKQVAELLGEKPTKLYHHMEALEKVGLVELSRTRRNRGTLEKYYVAVARTVHMDPRLFQATGSRSRGKRNEALRNMLSTIFNTTSAELNRLIDQGNVKGSLEEEGILSFLEIRGSKKQLGELKDKLKKLVQALTDPSEPLSESDERYRLTLAFYPLGKPEPDPSSKN
jgi:DNA-binding transcriptional ArsR family regulator